MDEIIKVLQEAGLQADHLNLDFVKQALPELARLAPKLSSTTIGDVVAVIQDIAAIEQSPEGQKLIADALKLLSDLK